MHMIQYIVIRDAYIFSKHFSVIYQPNIPCIKYNSSMMLWDESLHCLFGTLADKICIIFPLSNTLSLMFTLFYD